MWLLARAHDNIRVPGYQTMLGDIWLISLGLKRQVSSYIIHKKLSFWMLLTKDNSLSLILCKFTELSWSNYSSFLLFYHKQQFALLECLFQVVIFMYTHFINLDLSNPQAIFIKWLTLVNVLYKSLDTLPRENVTLSVHTDFLSSLVMVL